MSGTDQAALDPIPSRLSPRVLDVVLASAVTVTVSLVITADVTGTGPDAPAYLWAVGLGALMVVRRRYPVLVVVLSVAGLITYYIADYPPIGVAVPVAAAVFSAAEVGRLAPAVLGSAVVLLVSTMYRLAADQDPGFVLYELAGHLLLLAAAVALGDSLRSRREAHDRAGEVATLVAEQSRRDAAAQLSAERLAISRDLHDSLGHANAVVALHAQVAAEAVGRDDAAALQALEVVSSTTAASMAELRQTVALLRRGSTPSPEPARLRDIAAALRPAQQAGIEVITEIALPAQPLPVPVETAAYRIVQESIINVARHAKASRAVLEIWIAGGDELHIRVVDNGIASVTAAPHQEGRAIGHGLAGMRERAEAVGGTLIAGPTADGYQVRARLPLAVRS